jgi:hypothetical protein
VNLWQTLDHQASRTPDKVLLRFEAEQHSYAGLAAAALRWGAVFRGLGVLPGETVPRYVELRAALPKTATERVEKYKLKQEGIGGAWDRDASGYVVKRG